MRTIALSLLVLFSVQFIPVSVVGSFLYSNQPIEELPHGYSSSGPGCFSPAEHVPHLLAGYIFGRQLPEDGSRKMTGVCTDSSVHSRSADDIQTPPPNA